MKKTIIAFLLFSYNIIFTQSGKVIFEAELLKEKIIEKGKPTELDSQLSKIINNQKKVKYLLEFNKLESIFYNLERLYKEERKLNLVKILIGKGKYYYSKDSEKFLHQNEFLGELFLIEKDKSSWEITQEKKKIGKYICFKATTKKVIQTRRGKSEINIIAWFTPELPYNFGPKDYNGLPGLILELQEDKLLIKVKEINISFDDEIKVNRPKKGINVSEKQYDSIVKKIVTNRKKNRY